MGLRWQKRIKIAPGVKLNMTHKGVSTSVGRRGASVTVGRGKVRGTVGAPGTGLSYTAEKSYSGQRRRQAAAVPVWFALVAIAAVLLFVWWISRR